MTRVYLDGKEWARDDSTGDWWIFDQDGNPQTNASDELAPALHRIAAFEAIAKDALMLRTEEMRNNGGGVFDFTIIPDNAAREEILNRLIDTTA